MKDQSAAARASRSWPRGSGTQSGNSAESRNFTKREDEAKAYAAFCQYYGLEPTRDNTVEAALGHLKAALREELERVRRASLRLGARIIENLNEAEVAEIAKTHGNQ